MAVKALSAFVALQTCPVSFLIKIVLDLYMNGRGVEMAMHDKSGRVVWLLQLKVSY